MNNSQQTIHVGLFFVLGLALTWVTFATLSGGSIFKAQGYRLIAGFESLKELKKGDEVRMAGVTIGSVESTRLDMAHRRGEARLGLLGDGAGRHEGRTRGVEGSAECGVRGVGGRRSEMLLRESTS